jgi:hypothetical protein
VWAAECDRLVIAARQVDSEPLLHTKLATIVRAPKHGKPYGLEKSRES